MPTAPDLNTSAPHPARVYDYWLGGTDNFEADRQAATSAMEIFPHTVQSARACRRYLARVVRFLAAAGQILDFSQPVAVMLLAVLHFVTDEQDPAGLIRAVMDPLAPGSYLALGHHTADIFPELEEFSRYLSRLNPEYTATLRSRDQVTGFFGDLELVPPGVVQISQWRPDSDYDADLPAALWGGVARKRDSRINCE